MSNFWSTLFAEELQWLCPTLGCQATYCFSHGIGHLLVPLLEGVLVVSLVRRLAAAVRHRDTVYDLDSVSHSAM